MVPLADAVKQLLPVVVMEKLNGDPAVEVGVPLIVIVFPATEALTPAGNPVTVALVAPPLNEYVIEVMAVFIQSVWLVVDAAEVKLRA